MQSKDAKRGGWSGKERRSPPDITRITGGLRGPLGAIAVASVGLFLIAPPVGAFLILAAFLGVVGFGVYRVWTPAMDWLERAPSSIEQASEEMRELWEPVAALRQAGEQVEAITSGASAEQAGEPRMVRDDGSGLSDLVLDQATQFVLGGTVALFLLYFLLALDDLFLRKLASVLPGMSQRRKAVLIARGTEQDLTHYVLLSTVINIAFGTAVGCGLWLVGMPNPVLWGALAGVLNVVPYLGGLIGYIIVGVVALTTFESTASALLAPGTTSF